MKAMILKGFGEVENFQIAEVPLPDPQDNEVTIKIKAIGINPMDVITRKGNGLASNYKDAGYFILGWDISGEVVAAGSSVTRFKIGDDVFGSVNFPGQGNAYATYVNATESHLAIKPSNISHEMAAASALASLVVWQGFNGNTLLKPGSRLLIHGAAGSIGHMAIQLALLTGAFVIAASDAEHHEFISSLGAHQFIPYDKIAFETEATDLDVVLDTIGGDFTLRSLKAMKWGSHLITLSNGQKSDIVETAAYSGINARLMLASSNGDDMDTIAGFLKESAIAPRIFKTFSFEHIPEAHRLLENGGVEGKLVVSLG